MTGPGRARARVVTVSDRSAAGQRPDSSGPLAAALLADVDGVAEVDPVRVVPDDVGAVRAEIRAAVADQVDVLVTVGGTGVAPRDVTPEATAAELERTIPGIAEALRATAAPRIPTAVLSRGLAGCIGTMLVVNLPGSSGGVRDGVAVLRPLVSHLLGQLRGDDH
jgi:molybdenum cofactor synthesis domain-containing protein